MILTPLERKEVLYACHIARCLLENKFKDKGPEFDLPYEKRKEEAEKMLRLCTCYCRQGSEKRIDLIGTNIG